MHINVYPAKGEVRTSGFSVDPVVVPLLVCMISLEPVCGISPNLHGLSLGKARCRLNFGDLELIFKGKVKSVEKCLVCTPSPGGIYGFLPNLHSVSL